MENKCLFFHILFVKEVIGPKLPKNHENFRNKVKIISRESGEKLK